METKIKIPVSLILGMLALIGCDSDLDPAPTPKFTHTAINETGMALKLLSCPSCEPVTVGIGATVTFKSDVQFSEIVIQSVEATTKTIEFKESAADTYTLTAYEYEIMYRVTSTNATVEVTLINGDGGTSQYTLTQTSANYQFRSFSGTLAQVSAKVTSASGTPWVYIFHKDKRIQEATGNGNGAIATASATIE